MLFWSVHLYCFVLTSCLLSFPPYANIFLFISNKYSISLIYCTVFFCLSFDCILVYIYSLWFRFFAKFPYFCLSFDCALELVLFFCDFACSQSFLISPYSLISNPVFIFLLGFLWEYHFFPWRAIPLQRLNHLVHWSLAKWEECSPVVRETRVQSRVESYQRLKMWYLMPRCLTHSCRIKGSSVKLSNAGKGVVLPLHLGVVAIKNGALGSPSTSVTNFTYVFQ